MTIVGAWSLCEGVSVVRPNESAAQVQNQTTTLKSVQLHGAKEMTNAELKTVFPTPAPFDSLAFQAQLDELKKRYIRSGYYDVRIDSVRWRAEPEAYQNLHAEIFLSEGPITKISQIHFSGNRLLSENELRLLMQTHEGEVLNGQVLEKDFDAILARYETLGRAFAKISIAAIERIANSATEAGLRLHLAIHEGAWVKIAGYKFSDSLNTQHETILRELPLKVGEGYNEEKFSQIKPRLERLGFFERVSEPELLIVQKPTQDDTLQAIIKLDLVEGNANTFDGILGYQPPIPPEESGFLTGLVNISLRNLFGSGRRLGVRWQRPNNFTQELRVDYQEPWILGLPLNASFEAMQLQQDSSFSQLLLAGNLAYRLSENFSVAALIQIERINPIIQGVRRQDPILQSGILLTGVGIMYDTRDYPLNPTSGVLLRNEYRIGTKTINAPDSLVAALQVRQSVVQQRIGVEVEWYQPTFLRQVLALRVVGTALLAEEVQFSDLFRFGGAQSLRGYREQEFLASRYGFANIEYRLQLSRKSFAFLFYDVGYFFKPQNPLNVLDTAREGWRQGVGIGARLDTPLGLLGVSYALGEGDTLLRGKVHVNLINLF
jgi:outer membrane protein insertion porin family